MVEEIKMLSALELIKPLTFSLHFEKRDCKLCSWFSVQEREVSEFYTWAAEMKSISVVLWPKFPRSSPIILPVKKLRTRRGLNVTQDKSGKATSAAHIAWHHCFFDQSFTCNTVLPPVKNPILGLGNKIFLCKLNHPNNIWGNDMQSDTVPTQGQGGMTSTRLKVIHCL